jgi:signal transduction histidine kinase
MLHSPWQPELPTGAGALAEQILEPRRRLDADLQVLLASEDLVDRTDPERRQRDFMLLVGHELRNPLTAIIGYAQRMQRTGSYNEQALATIVAQARQIERLVGDLLDSSRLEVGQQRLEPSQTDLVALARAVTEQAQLTSPFHVVRLESPDGPLEGWWDRGRLTQVFANLLANAIKYSPAGGEILVQVEDLGTAARVSIEDHGAGIAPAALPHLFDRFYRAPATAARVPGLGLGLHISRALVEAHGGSVQVESLLGQGTVFSFILPRVHRVPDAVGYQRSGLRAVGGEIGGGRP